MAIAMLATPPMFVRPNIAEWVGVRKAYPTGDALPRSNVLRATILSGLTVRGGMVMRTARDLLLQGRHVGHDRSLSTAPARLRRPDALRRLHGGVGEGPRAVH